MSLKDRFNSLCETPALHARAHTRARRCWERLIHTFITELRSPESLKGAPAKWLQGIEEGNGCARSCVRACSPAGTVPSTVECSPYGLLKQTHWPPLRGERQSLSVAFSSPRESASNFFGCEIVQRKIKIQELSPSSESSFFLLSRC